MLESILIYGKSSARIVFASSSQVYPLANFKSPLPETKKANPGTVYGVSKLGAENLIRISGVPFTILRMSNVYGPGCRPNYNSVVATLCDRAVKGLPLLINGDGRQSRDFVYVDDMVRAFLLAGLGPATERIFNVSSGRMISLRKIVKQIERLHRNTKVEFLMDKSNSEKSYCCDASKFSEKYSWHPRVSLSKGIEQTLSYCRRRK